LCVTPGTCLAVRGGAGGDRLTSAAYFDVDGTLVGTSLVHPAAYFLANQASIGRSALRLGRALAGAPAMAWAEVRDRRLFNELLFSHYAGMSEDRVMVLAEEVFDEVIAPRIYPGTPDLVRKCKAAGQRVVFITGSLDVTMQRLAKELGADHVIANRLEFKSRRATGKLVRPVVAGPTKARLISDDAREHGHDLAECFGYSDSYSDVPMLSVVGHPYCVHPDAKLARLARAYQWPILDLKRAARHPSP